MKPYTKTYFDFFGFTIADFIPCEICGERAIDIHHIWARSIRKDLVNAINNIMALCRLCHTEFGDKKEQREYLQSVHNNYMDANGKS